MAFLSWAAYYDAVKGEPGNNIDGSGWTLVVDYKSPTLPNVEGYLAWKGNTLALVFEGSHTPEDFAAAALSQEEYFNAIEGLVIQALAYAASHDNITSIYVTGHSLGGAMAEWFAHRWAPQFAETLDVSVATFGSPGTDISSAGNPYVEKIVHVGNSEDDVFNHTRLVALIEGINLLNRDGVSITVELPRISPADSREDPFGEHDAFLYERAMGALAASPFGDSFLASPNSRDLVVDTLLSASDETFLSLFGRAENLLVLGDSGLDFPDNDTIGGSFKDDWIDGGKGDDVLQGGPGNDVLRGGSGNDTLEGATGDDFVVDTAGLDSISGGSGNDTIVSEIGPDIIDGGTGNDRITSGQNHNYTLMGGAGNDTLESSADFGSGGYFYGGTGDDLIMGNNAFVLAMYEDALGPVTIDLGLVTPQAVGGGLGIDTLINVHVVGGSFGDTIVGNAQENRIYGGPGADFISGRGGNDVLVGSGFFVAGDSAADTLSGDAGDDQLYATPGGDRLDGGANFDVAYFTHGTGAVSVDLVLSGAPQHVGGTIGSVTLISVEGLFGFNGSDTLSGDDSANSLNGHVGNDLLVGRGGADTLDDLIGNNTLVAGAGEDVLRTGDGNDRIDGGLGVDWVQFTFNNGPITANLAVSGPQATGGAGVDTFIGIENLLGSSYNDSLSGDAGNNSLDGAGGNDSIAGADGNDSLQGGSDLASGGSDSLDGGNGHDLLIGGIGNDLLIGGNGNDFLRGDSGHDSLDGGVNNDTLSGGVGNDMLIGGRGNDVLRGDGGADLFVFSRGPGRDSVSDFAVGTDHLRLIDGLAVKSWSQVGSDTVIVFNEPAAQVTLVGVTGLTAATFGSLFDG